MEEPVGKYPQLELQLVEARWECKEGFNLPILHPIQSYAFELTFANIWRFKTNLGTVKVQPTSFAENRR